MDIKEAIEIVEEVAEIDDSMWQYSSPYINALKTILEEVKRRVPEIPVEGYKYGDWFRKRLKEMGDKFDQADQRGSCCPNCGRSLHELDKRMTGGKILWGDNYCKWCGQAIDWDRLNKQNNTQDNNME